MVKRMRDDEEVTETVTQRGIGCVFLASFFLLFIFPFSFFLPYSIDSETETFCVLKSSNAIIFSLSLTVLVFSHY